MFLKILYIPCALLMYSGDNGPRCVCLVDRKTKMAVPLSDWRGHFLLLLCYLWTEYNETGHATSTQRPLPSLFFRVDWKIKMAALASDTLILFRRLCNRWTEFNKTLQEARTRHPLLSSVCFRPIGNQDCCPDFWLAERFLYSLQPQNRIQQNFTGDNISTSSTKFVFSGRSENQDGRPGLWLTVTF